MWDDPPHRRPPAGRQLPSERTEKWRRGFEHRADATEGEPGSIWSQHVHMAHIRHVYMRVFEIARAVPDMPPSAYFDYLGYTYVHTQGVAIRRQADEHPRAVSLGRLLGELPERLGA
jgi:hypothetical protein